MQKALKFQSHYKIPSGHVETIIPYYLRPIIKVNFARERIDTTDGDFLDIDWLKGGHKRLLILSHGLEGSTGSHYIRAMTKYFGDFGYDILAWNSRGCSGVTNRLMKTYHSGMSEDLRDVICHVNKQSDYEKIDLVGFSMGGNITLKYLGEQGSDLDSNINSAIAFSTPVCLTSCAINLSKGINKIYTKHFINSLLLKLKEKKEIFSEFNLNIKELKRIWNFETFDSKVTAPLNGFKDARDYWKQASSISKLSNVQIPSLIVNAQNDPFLVDRCYPIEETQNHKFISLEMPKYGGHVGFRQASAKAAYWTELRTHEFLKSTK